MSLIEYRREWRRASQDSLINWAEVDANYKLGRTVTEALTRIRNQS